VVSRSPPEFTGELRRAARVAGGRHPLGAHDIVVPLAAGTDRWVNAVGGPPEGVLLIAGDKHGVKAAERWRSSSRRIRGTRRIH
jgi:hypothetical protein